MTYSTITDIRTKFAAGKTTVLPFYYPGQSNVVPFAQVSLPQNVGSTLYVLEFAATARVSLYDKISEGGFSASGSFGLTTPTRFQDNKGSRSNFFFATILDIPSPPVFPPILSLTSYTDSDGTTGRASPVTYNNLGSSINNGVLYYIQCLYGNAIASSNGIRSIQTANIASFPTGAFGASYLMHRITSSSLPVVNSSISVRSTIRDGISGIYPIASSASLYIGGYTLNPFSGYVVIGWD